MQRVKQLSNIGIPVQADTLDSGEQILSNQSVRSLQSSFIHVTLEKNYLGQRIEYTFHVTLTLYSLLFTLHPAALTLISPLMVLRHMLRRMLRRMLLIRARLP